jgi:low affinity Fe/Cu permease
MTFQYPDTQLTKRFVWGGILTVLTVASTLAVACGTPFAALATLAALFLPRRDAFVLIAVNWLANQAIGFGLLHYPLNWDCYRGGINLGIAALLSTMAALLAQGALRNVATTVRAIGSFAVAFVAYEGTLFVMSPAGSMADFAAPVVLYIFYVNAVAFVALLLLQTAAAALGFISSMAAFRYGAAVPRDGAGDRP